jgi:hypothetical protein
MWFSCSLGENIIVRDASVEVQLPIFLMVQVYTLTSEPAIYTTSK